jgi:hypothetical protein
MHQQVDVLTIAAHKILPHPERRPGNPMAAKPNTKSIDYLPSQELARIRRARHEKSEMDGHQSRKRLPKKLRGMCSLTEHAHIARSKGVRQLAAVHWNTSQE